LAAYGKIFKTRKLVEDIAKLGIDGALDKTVNITAPYTADYFNTELMGLADASGVDFKMIQRIHMLGMYINFDRKMVTKFQKQNL